MHYREITLGFPFSVIFSDRLRSIVQYLFADGMFGKARILLESKERKRTIMKHKRCVVTGLGLICATGNNIEENIKNIFGGISGIDKVKAFSTEGCYAELGAEVPLEDRELPGEDFDRATLLCVKAAEEAVSNAGLDLSDEKTRNRTGVIVGDCVAGVASIDRFYTAEANGNGDPSDIGKMTATAIANNVALHFNLGGVTANIVNACAAGTISLSMACDEIRAGRADIFLAGGTDSFSSLAFGGFHALHALDSQPCSPFNRSSGITLGEGSGMLVIESYEHAKARGARIYCEISGSGISSDAYHITAPRPDGEGQMNAIRQALNSAGLSPDDIDYINAHGTGTAKNDEAEFLSLHTVFDGNSHLSVSSTKSMTGHCLGAAGAIEAVISVLSLTKNMAPPTVGYSDSDLETLKQKAGKIDFIPNTARVKNIERVMSNSFAFGGNNASIIFSKSLSENTDKPCDGSKKIYICGIGRLMSAKPEDNPALSHAEINSGSFSELGIKMAFYRKLDRFSQLLLISGVRALKDAGLSPLPEDENALDFGISIGTSDGPLTEIAEFQKTIVEKGAAGGNAFSFPNTVYNAAGGYLSIFTGIKGYNVTIANSAQAGIQSVCNACDILTRGGEKTMLAAGVDENTHITEQLYSRLGLLGDNLPYSLKDDRSPLGEGAVSLVLTTEKKSKTYAQITGWGEAHRSVSPQDPEGSEPAMADAVMSALSMADISVSDIDFICGFANGSKSVDSFELAVYRSLFGKNLPTVYSSRSETADARAASCADQIALACSLLQGGCHVPSIGNPPEKKEYALCVGYGCGGSYSAVLLRRTDN